MGPGKGHLHTSRFQEVIVRKGSQQPHMTNSGAQASNHNDHRNGFTLVEMMVVVIIIGILGSLAVPTYRRYITWSRTQEARSFLPLLRAKQRVYFQEHRQYLDISYTRGANPKNMPQDGATQPWFSTTAPSDYRFRWIMLGARPGTLQTYFQYWSPASLPPTPQRPSPTAPKATECNGVVPMASGIRATRDKPAVPPSYPAGGQWFAVCARGNLSGTKTLYFGMSGADGFGNIFTNFQ